MRVRRALLVLPVLAVSFTMTPGHAASRVTCSLVGSVSLNQGANLFTSDKGTGSFVAGSLLRCAGTVSGSGTSTSGNFTFCQHNLSSGNAACHSTSKNGPGLPLDALYDNTNKGPAKVATHAFGSASFSGFTGGTSCSLTFEGHAYGTQAELVIKSFNCSNGFNGKGQAVANAIPQPTGVSGCPAGPGGARLCFKKLLFNGAIAVTGP